jgi:uncharacterized membrane protein YdbT with pleckstrin-like domain
MVNIEDHLQSNEKILYSGNPFFMGYIWSYLFSILAFLIVGVLAVFDLITYSLLIIPGVLLLVILLDRYSKQYIITNKRIMTIKSMFSEEIKASSFRHITSISVKRTLSGKLFNFGTLRIHTSASGNSPEFNWKFIDKPLEVRHFLEGKIK